MAKSKLCHIFFLIGQRHDIHKERRPVHARKKQQAPAHQAACSPQQAAHSEPVQPQKRTKGALRDGTICTCSGRSLARSNSHANRSEPIGSRDRLRLGTAGALSNDLPDGKVVGGARAPPERNRSSARGSRGETLRLRGKRREPRRASGRRCSGNSSRHRCADRLLDVV